MERELLGKFKENLNAKFDFKVSKNVNHVDELDHNNIRVNAMDFGSIHKIHPEAVEYKDKYLDTYSAGSKPSVTYSDPYNEIYGGRYSG